MNATTCFIKELTTEDEWLEAYPVMHQLRTHLDEKSFVFAVSEMTGQGYKLFALYEDTRVVAVTGIILLTNLYDGKHVYVYDLVTDSTHRSKGYGDKLLTFVREWGKERGCHTITLSSGLQRTDAHRFYENKMKFKRTSFVFKYSF